MIGLFIFTFTSCEKDYEESNTSSTKSGKGFKILSYSSPNARGVVNNILSFESEAEYYNTLDSLENEYTKYSETFNQTFQGLTDEEINESILSNNIDLEKPLTDFEEFYNFTSLRNSINEKERLWLLNPNPDFTACPQVHSISSFEERCLWNEKGEIMVAGKIYKYTEDDTKYIKIEDGDLTKLTLINSGDLMVFNDPMVSIVSIDSENTSTSVTSASTLSCANTSGNSIPYSIGIYKIVCSNRLKAKDWTFGKHSLSANTKTYKRIGETYYKFVTSINVNINGQRYENCNNTAKNIFLNKTIYNSVVNVELKRNYKISTKYDASMSTLNSHHGAGTPSSTSTYFPSFEANLRLKY